MKRVAFLLPIAAVLLWPAADDGGASLLPDGPGKAVVAKVCTECHSVDRMRTLRIGKDDWDEKIADMIDRGATATDAEKQALATYLTANFGPDSKIHINTAPMIELKAILLLNVAESQGLVAYRKANGDFKSWDDLLKVPGIDPQKLQAKKDLIAF